MSHALFGHRLAPLLCPHCGSPNDGHMGTEVDDSRPPKDGDMSVCFQCARLSMYVGTPPMGLRELTDEEAVEAASNEEWQRARRAVLAYRMRTS